MPLADNEQTRGKCGFKMIQYMAVGVPVIASAVGANIQIFEGSGAGLLVEPGGDWSSAIGQLARDASLRADCSAAGRRHAVENFSINSVIERYTKIFRALA
jgi:glycosyltransferase involved in cell wall biosynthesis